MKNFILLFSLLLILSLNGFFISVAVSTTAGILRETPTDDAYVVSSSSALDDKSGFEETNTGDYEFLKIWYAYNVAEEANELDYSLGHLKFDISVQLEDVTSVKLFMQPLEVDSLQDEIEIHIYSVEDDSWTESELIDANKPEFNQKPIARAVQSGACPTATSNFITITVDPTTVAGTLSPTGPTTICEGSTADLSLAGETGIILRWEREFNGGGFVDIGNGGSATLSDALATAGTYRYQVVVQSGVCALAISNIETFIVDPASNGGTLTVAASTTICETGTTPLN